MCKVIPAALKLYVVLSIGMLVSVLLHMSTPQISWQQFAELGPHTNRIALMVSLLFTWLLLGSVLLMVGFGKITVNNIVAVICGVAICLLYLSFLRERVEFGDFTSYTNNARLFLEGKPQAKWFAYPPLWPSFIACFYRISPFLAVVACFVVNQLSFAAFFILGVLFLRRCRISLNLAGILLFLAMVVNVPLLRNLVYVQVSLLMVDLVLASILLFPKSKGLSALFLALGVHLKVAPLFFSPVFFIKKQWSWLLYFIFWGLAMVLLVCFTFGGSHFFDFYDRLTAYFPLQFRSCTFDGLLVNTSAFLGWDFLPVDAIAYTLRVTLVIWIYVVAYIAIRKQTFACSNDAASDRIINGIIPLFFFDAGHAARNVGSLPDRFNHPGSSVVSTASWPVANFPFLFWIFLHLPASSFRLVSMVIPEACRLDDSAGIDESYYHKGRGSRLGQIRRHNA